MKDLSPVLAIMSLVAVAVVLILRHSWQARARAQHAKAHLSRLAEGLPGRYSQRELLKAFYAPYYDLPDRFLELGEPSFAPDRLGWMLGMTDRLGKGTILNCSYLRPGVHPGVASYVAALEFWIDFEYEGRRWAVWYPSTDYAVVERLEFGRHYVSSTHRRHTHEEIAAWLRRSGFS